MNNKNREPKPPRRPDGGRIPGNELPRPKNLPRSPSSVLGTNNSLLHRRPMQSDRITPSDDRTSRTSFVISIGPDGTEAGGQISEQEQIEAPSPDSQIPEDALKSISSIVNGLSKVLCKIYPEAEGKALTFTIKGIFLDSKKIGEVEITSQTVKLRIWMHKLDYTMATLPSPVIFGLFNISESLILVAKKQAEYASLFTEVANTNQKSEVIWVCFHKSEAPAAFLTAPLRISQKGKLA